MKHIHVGELDSPINKVQTSSIGNNKGVAIIILAARKFLNFRF